MLPWITLDEARNPDGTLLTDERAAETGQRMIDEGIRARDHSAGGGARTRMPFGTGT